MPTPTPGYANAGSAALSATVFDDGTGALKVVTPATPLPVITAGASDSTGIAFNPDSCAHTYAYSAGLLVTDTATDGTTTWVKTLGYTAGVLTSESKWVRQ